MVLSLKAIGLKLRSILLPSEFGLTIFEAALPFIFKMYRYCVHSQQCSSA
jgi:hypothetical protein